MAFTAQSNNSGSVFNLAYSAFLGGVYLVTPETDAFIAEAKKLVGEAEVKKGYTGNTGATAQARKFLKEKGVTFGNISGKLVHANLRKTDKDGRSYTYVNVCVRDADGLYCLAVPAGHESAQLLTRKLANAKFGEETTIALFAVYEKSQNPDYPDRMFAKHIASVKQNGEEVTGVSPSPIKTLVDAQLGKLKESGIDDKDVLKKARDGVVNQFHFGIWTDIDAHVASYKASRGDNEAPAPDEPAPAAAPQHPASSGFDDMDDDIPF
jgi:hypothetical protein